MAFAWVCALTASIAIGADAKPASGGDVGKYREIVERAPFRLKGSLNAGAADSASQIHFNGLVKIGDKVTAALEDTASRRTYVLAPGESKEGVKLETIDEKNKTVALTFNGLPLVLSLEKASPASAFAANMQQPGVVPGAAPGYPQPGAATAAPVMPGYPVMTNQFIANPNSNPPGTINTPVGRRRMINIPRER
ncbi:MAG: hypothetical protein JO317_03110 [Verrucomicrobiae bacterium]|nr:hypothetical protein [Verrucomicrobiae bacterium]